MISQESYDLAKSKGYLKENSLMHLEWWLREEKNIHCEIFLSMFHKKWAINNYLIDLKKLKKIELTGKLPQFETYPLALKFAIEQMLNKV